MLRVWFIEPMTHDVWKWYKMHDFRSLYGFTTCTSSYWFITCMLYLLIYYSYAVSIDLLLVRWLNELIRAFLYMSIYLYDLWFDLRQWQDDWFIWFKLIWWFIYIFMYFHELHWFYDHMNATVMNWPITCILILYCALK